VKDKETKTMRRRITRLKKSKSASRLSEQKLRQTSNFCETLLATLPFGMDIVDMEGNILFISEKLKAIFGKGNIAKKCWVMYRDGKTQCSDCPLKKDLKIGETATIEAQGCLGGKTLLITHTGMIYKKKKAILEIFQDITKRRKAKEALIDLNRRKSIFVSNVSHEFKNPLGVTREFLNMVLNGHAGKISSEQKKLLEVGKNNIERLIRLVTNLLDVSKIESGKLVIKRENMDIASLVKEIVTTQERAIFKKQITLKKDILQDIGSLWADRDMLTEVIINLLDNAIKHTPSRGEINIRVKGAEREVRFEISDTGPGIPHESYDKIFDKFERITAEKQEGTGLGLPIAKDIVELHKGRIWIESKIGKGSKFIFTLPKGLRKQQRE